MVLMVCVRTDDVLLPKFASPEYVAVIECAPTERLDVLKVACSTNPFSRAGPSSVAPSKKDTVPVAVSGSLSLTVAVNVTDAPTADGFADDITDVLVPVDNLATKASPSLA